MTRAAIVERSRDRLPALLLGGLVLGFVPAGLEAQSVELGAVPEVEASSALSPRTASYTIEVFLDAESKSLEGKQVLTWQNQTEHPTSELRFHLYFNGWRNSESSWLQQSVLGQRRRRRDFAKLAGEDWGYTTVDSIRLLGPAFGEVDLSAQAFFDAPDDGNPEDRTVLVVPLPLEVAPGETIEVAMDWFVKIPRTFARTGFRGQSFLLAHWFPKVGVLEPDGTWNCHQFHAATEFFADYGKYDVKITVPSGWKLGATGQSLAVEENLDDTSTHHYQASDVHGFAWTTSPSYREAQQRFEVPGLAPVDMRLLYQPEHESQVERHFRATAATLEYYGKWFGEYPYPQVTVIDPAWGSGTGGMEYPTLFTCGSRYFNPEGSGSPEGVTIHEAGHQFWYGIVGSNEFEDAWLDEGLNTFATARVQDVALGPRFYVRRFFRGFFPVMNRDIVLDRMIAGNRLDRYRPHARRDIQATPTFLYDPESASNITYAKTALWLATLERTLGWETLRQILSTYFERWKFRHPGPSDFFAVVNEVAGKDLTPFFDQVYRKAALFDYSVDVVRSRPWKQPGYHGGEGALVYSAGADDSSGSGGSPAPGEAPSDNGEPLANGTEDSPEYETRVVVRRLQDGVLPVEVLLRFDDGEEIRELWDGKELHKEYRLVRPARLTFAVVDPQRKLLLDLDYTNNSKLVEGKASLPATKWASKWMVWLQEYLHALSFLI